MFNCMFSYRLLGPGIADGQEVHNKVAASGTLFYCSNQGRHQLKVKLDDECLMYFKLQGLLLT